MKRIIFLCINLLAVYGIFAEVITMDLTTATDMNATPIVYSSSYGLGYYDGTHVWKETYNDDDMYQFIYTNDARFKLSHMPSQNSYGGQSWEGFTLSRVAQDTANVFGCVANGGIAGEGTPYVVGYFSDWITASQGYSSNLILFDDYYYPEYIYICQNSNTMEAIANGGVFNARPFTESDTLSLIISALDSNMQESQHIIYYLAVDGQMNSGWCKVSLEALGKTQGLSFRMTTTDTSDWGANTPMYFALDALTVNTDFTTDIINTHTTHCHSLKKRMHNGNLYIIHNNNVYNITGQMMKSF